MCHAQFMVQLPFRCPMNGTPLLVTARALPSGNTSEVDIFEFSIFDRTSCRHLLLPLLLVGSATSGSTSVPLSYYFTPPKSRAYRYFSVDSEC